MPKNSFWSGLFFGALTGVAVTLMINNKAAEVVEGEKEQHQGVLDTVLKICQKNSQAPKAATKSTAEEAEEDTFLAKLDINQKLTALEEALKELREEKRG